MSIGTKKIAALVLGVALTAAIGSQSAQAQVRYTRQIPTVQQLNPVNPYWKVSPGLSQSQYLYNFTANAQALQQVPPYLYGYNPYPPVIYQQNYVTPPVYTPYNYTPYGNYGYPSLPNYGTGFYGY